jgi:hypothetical protein
MKFILKGQGVEWREGEEGKKGIDFHHFCISTLCGG